MSLTLYIDKINDFSLVGSRLRVARGFPLKIDGWAVDITSRLTPPVFAAVDEGIVRLAASPVERGDVADFFHDDELRFGGFSVSIPIDSDLIVGEHDITLGTYDGERFVVMVHLPIDVVDAIHTKETLTANYVQSPLDNVWSRKGAGPPEAFAYSDGEKIENYLLEVVRRSADLSNGSEQLESYILDFPTRYHLSASRSNLLRPISEMLTGRILEIGAGCGAITRFLGESAAEVVAVEGSPRRAAIAAARCRDLPNVAVIAGRVQSVVSIGEFDVVTLIGVLEYARSFATSSEIDPVAALLAHARTFLKPGGTLLVAIENQLGLKYFAGYPEDHLGQPMAGIEDRYGAKTAVTFGRTVLSQSLREAGLGEQRWFYPFPDYKCVSAVVTEAGASCDAGDSFAWAIAQTGLIDPQRPALTTFALQRVWPTIMRNGLLADLANSFLVAASDQPILQEEALLAVYYGGIRRRSVQKETRFLREPDGIWVRRAKLYPSLPAPAHLGFTLSDEFLEPGRLLDQELIGQTGQDGWNIAEWADILSPWFTALRNRFDLPQRLSPSLMIPGCAIDAVPRNLVIAADGATTFIDQEWQPNGEVPLGYILFRALFSVLSSVEQCAPAAEGQSTHVQSLISKVFVTLGWEISEAALRNYWAMEDSFYSDVFVKRPVAFEQALGFTLRVRQH